MGEPRNTLAEEHLRQIKYEDKFREFMKMLKENGLALYTKRSNRYCFGFNVDRDRVYYMIDGSGSGSCELSNLYKYLKVDDA